MIFLVSELSASNNLIDKNYTNNCLEISDSVDSIVGCVCQNNISKKYLNIVPGISDSNSKDNMGQIYNNPANKSFADFFVNGRAINNHDNPLNKIINLKKH